MKITQKQIRVYILSCMLMASGTIKCATLANDGRTPYIDPLQIQFMAGINKSANENLPMSEYSKYPISFGAFVSLARERNVHWGWRMALRYNHNKSRNVQICESKQTWGWNSISTFADITYDLTDGYRRRYRKQAPPFNLKAFAGAGLAYTYNFDNVPLSYSVPYSRKSQIVPAARVGLLAGYRVAKDWNIMAELSYTVFTDRFNGVKSGCIIDGRSNLNIGVAYAFGKRRVKYCVVEPVMPVVYDTRLRMMPALPFVLPQAEGTKHRQLMGRAFLDFPVNETIIYPRYRRNPQELKRICATIDSALFDKTIQVTSISLHGYASPESPYSNNTRLAKGRTAALKDYLRKHYKLSANLFHTTFTPEDWTNLRGFIADTERRRTKGDIWYESASILETPEAPACVIDNRDELLRVIDQKMDLDEKEQQLKRVAGGEPYKWLLQNVYPGLRHTDYVIEYVVRNYNVKEGRRLIYTHPEAMSLKEMYAVAQSYDEGSDGWFEALTIAAREYPGDYIANLNAACACVKVKRLTDAKRFLKNAGNIPQAQYLANVIKAMEGKCQWTIQGGKIVVTNE